MSTLFQPPGTLPPDEPYFIRVLLSLSQALFPAPTSYNSIWSV